MKRLFKFKQILLLTCVLCFGIAGMQVQDYRAIVQGVVTDETGEGVIGATVLVKNESTGFSAGSITNENGEYIVRQLPLGSPYSISVSYVGYGDQKKQAIR